MKLTHPDSGQTINPKAEHAAAYQSQGWVEVAEKPAPKTEGEKHTEK